MKLYIVERKQGDEGPVYDANWTQIVRASSPHAARVLASTNTGDEGPEAWLRTTRATVKELKVEGREEIILVEGRWS